MKGRVVGDEMECVQGPAVPSPRGHIRECRVNLKQGGKSSECLR